MRLIHILNKVKLCNRSVEETLTMHNSSDALLKLIVNRQLLREDEITQAFLCVPSHNINRHNSRLLCLIKTFYGYVASLLESSYVDDDDDLMESSQLR